MDKQYLIKGEELITQSDRDIVTLTNLRIRYTDSEFGKAHIVSIMLENISSIEVAYSSRLYLLFGGLLGLVGYLVTMDQQNGYGGLLALVGLVLIGLYLSSRRHYITIYSKGGTKIRFHAKGMKRAVILEFINKVEIAISQRSNLH